MAILFCSGFETGDFTDWQPSGPWGDCNVQSSIKKTGTYAMRCNPTDDDAYIQMTSLPAQNPKRVSFWLYIDSFQLPGDDNWIQVMSIGGVEIERDGHVRLDISTVKGWVEYDSEFMLESGKWYRISISLDTSTQKARAYVDGEVVSWADDCTNLKIDWQLGVLNSHVTCDFYFDDVVWDNVNSHEDIGDLRILNAKIIGAGNYTDFDSYVGSANHYENVDEIPPSDDDYNWQNAKSAVKECYSLENCSDIGLSETDVIKAVRTFCRMKRGSGGGSTHNILIRDNSQDYETPVSLSTSWSEYERIDESMPNGGGDWTQDRFNALEVGMSYGGEAQDPYLSFILATVVFSGIVDEPLPPTDTVAVISTVNSLSGTSWMW